METVKKIEALLGELLSSNGNAPLVNEIITNLSEVKEFIEEVAISNNELQVIRHELDISREKYKFLYDAAPSIFFTINEEGIITSANRTTSNLLKTNPNTICGKSISLFIHPVFIDSFLSNCKNSHQSSAPVACYLKMKSLDGDILTLNGAVDAVEINGAVEYYASFTDSTALEKSQEKIQEQERLFQILFERAGDATYLIDGDVYVDCNLKALEVFGLESKDELIGRHPHDFSPEYQPCGTSSVEKAVQMINQSYLNGVNHFEWLHFNKKTGLIFTDVTLTTIKKEGLNLILVSLRDITDKKLSDNKLIQSEANLSAAINYSNIAIGIFSDTGLIRQYNTQFSSIIKTISGIDIKFDSDISQIFKFGKSGDFWSEKFNIALCGEEVKFEYKFDEGNNIKYFDFSINPVKVNGSVSGFCIFVSEITKYKLTEKSLKDEKSRLEGQVQEQRTELREQSDLFSILIDSVPDLIFIKDKNGVYLNCNQAYCNYTGKPKSEIIGKFDNDLYSQSDAEQFARFDKSVFEAGISTRDEQLLTFPDGSTYIFDTIKTPYRDAESNIIGLIGISRDISELKKLEDDIKNINQELEAIIEKRTLKLQDEIHERVRAEDALKKSREMYRNLFNDIPIGIYRTTLDGRIILANPALVKMLGYSTMNELKQINLNEDGFLDRNERQEFINTVLSEDQIHHFEMVWRKYDGSIIYILEKAKAVKDSSGNIIYIEGTAEDVTDRKIAEKMQQTVYSISEAAYRFDNLDELYPFIHKAVSQLIYCHNFYIAIYDEHRKEILFPYIVDEIESPTPSRIGPYPFTNGLTEYVIKSETFHLLETEAIQKLEEENLCKVSGPMPVSWLGVPLRTTGNKTIGVIAVQSYNKNIKYDISAKDILVFVSTQIAMVIYRKHIEEALYSERKYLAERVLERTEELSALNAELERAVRTKDEFLANMSHELRTPLNAILGLSEILLKHKDFKENEKHRRAMTTIRESGSHLLNLINDILDLSKIEAGKMDINFEELNLENIGNTCINFVKQLALKKNINLSINIEENCPSVFWADQLRMKQILINLLNNAVKFTANGGSVGLDVYTTIDNSTLYFTVWDTGIGISLEDLNKLFKPFTQVSSNLARDYEGTGLGLSLVSKLTEMHGGSVTVESEVGMGSKFTVALPVKSPMIEFKQLEDLSDKTVNYIKKALIIEDSSDDSVLLADYLAKLNIKSEMFQFDKELEEVIDGNRYDVVFLDILLWDRSGWDILSSIKKNRKYDNLPIVVNSILKEKARALAYGADGFLNKPYTFNALYEILNKIDIKLEKASQINSIGEGILNVMENKTLILLAEDNEANLQTLDAFLEYAGFSVVVARNGREAVDTAIECKPDLILMDIQMPKMDGLEATRIIKQDNNLKDIPVIALTALAMPGDKDRCFAAGANQYVSKPVNFDTLVEAINSLLPEDKRVEVE